MTYEIMKTQITVTRTANGYKLIGEDGYSTSRKTYQTKELAMRAANRESRVNEIGKTSRMIWEY